MVPRSWYTSVELQQGTVEWEILAISFTQKFEFTSEYPTVDVALQVIKENIFEEIPVADTNFHQCNMNMHIWMECHNIMGDLYYSERVDILCIFHKEWEQWKEFACVKIHITLLDTT